jgi:hypothetical protein
MSVRTLATLPALCVILNLRGRLALVCRGGTGQAGLLLRALHLELNGAITFTNEL